MQHKNFAFLFVIPILFSACAILPIPNPIPTLPAEAKPQTFWNSEESNGKPCILVSLTRQRAYFFKGSKLVGESPISSGKKGFETPPGSYKVTQKDEKHVSNLYGEYVDENGGVMQTNVDVTKDPAPEGAVFQ